MISDAERMCCRLFPLPLACPLRVDLDPNPGPLQDNGGPTWTHLPLYRSAVINLGDTVLTFDQRGVARPQGAEDDIVAYEVEAATYTLTVSTDGTGGGTVTRDPAGIEGGSDCTESLTAGTVVTLSATAGRGSRMH